MESFYDDASPKSSLLLLLVGEVIIVVLIPECVCFGTNEGWRNEEEKRKIPLLCEVEFISGTNPERIRWSSQSTSRNIEKISSNI